MCLLSQTLNTYGAENWAVFSRINYFDRNGLFVGIMWAAPLLANLVLVVVCWTTFWKVRQLNTGIVNAFYGFSRCFFSDRSSAPWLQWRHSSCAQRGLLMWRRTHEHYEHSDCSFVHKVGIESGKLVTQRRPLHHPSRFPDHFSSRLARLTLEVYWLCLSCMTCGSR